MGRNQGDADAAALVAIQLIISLIVMPVTPILWICGAGNLTSLVQRLSRMSPAVWCVFFAVTMPGATSHIQDLFIRALVPSDFVDTMIVVLLSALGALISVAGSYYISRILRWGKPPEAVCEQVKPRESSSTDQLDSLEANTTTVQHCPPENETEECEVVSRKHIMDALFAIIEAVSVEIGWRVYLLPRLLFALSPLVSLLAMAVLATLSSLPAVLYVVCTDSPIVIRHINKDTPAGKHLFYRDPPPISSTCTYAVHLFLLNMAQGIVTILAQFCVWPAVVLSLYWQHIAYIVSGRMLIGTYLPKGMEILASARMQKKNLSSSVWIRGPPWKVSCEGLAGLLTAIPLLVASYGEIHNSWSRHHLKGMRGLHCAQSLVH